MLNQNNDTDFNILLVENSRTTRAILAKLLESNGYKVSLSSTGPEAIESIKTGQFQLVIMDLYMPQMNGYEAAKMIRNLDDEKINNIPIIALTASSSEKDIEISKQSGMNEFITKDDDNLSLLNCVKIYFENHYKSL